MSYDGYGQGYGVAARVSENERADFILKTYLHLFGAVVAFICIEAVLLMMPFSLALVRLMVTGAGGYSWLLVLGAFMVVSHVANRWAASAESLGTQYLGLGLYVVAEAFLFLPLLYIAANFAGASVIPSAAIVTLCVFTGLTAVVVFTRKNFSFLGPFLGVAAFAALGLIVCSILFGFSLGILFSGVMVVVASGYILFYTSKVLHEYRTDQYVAASLVLFASVALLFWYILRIFMSRD